MILDRCLISISGCVGAGADPVVAACVGVVALDIPALGFFVVGIFLRPVCGVNAVFLRPVCGVDTVLLL